MSCRVRGRARSLLSCLVLAAAAVSPASARQGEGAVAGVVQAAGSGAALAGIVVHVENTDLAATTDAVGRFRLAGVPAGSHVISFVGPTVESRRVDVVVTGEETRDLDLGIITLASSTGPGFTVAGVVRDVRTGAGIPAAAVRLNGVVAAVTDDAGRFRIVTGNVRRGEPNRVEVRRIGYAPAHREFAARDEEGPELAFALEPAPVALDDVEIEAEGVQLTTGRMTGFFRRRDMGLGQFFTRDEIANLGATRVSDVFRRVPGAIVITEDNMTEAFGPQRRFAGMPQTSIQFSRRGYARDAGSRPCSPLLFVNDVLIAGGDVDGFGRVTDVVGLEVYTSAAEIPPEYNRRGSGCGVIVMWTDAPPGQGRGFAAGLEVGAHLGVRLSGERLLAERLGLQLLVPLFGVFEFRPGFNLAFDGPDRSRKAGWQALANVAARPLRRLSPWYVGTGVAVTKYRGANTDVFVGTTSQLSHVLLSGVSLAVGPLRPFLEFQVFDLLGTGTQTIGYTGFSIRAQ